MIPVSGKIQGTASGVAVTPEPYFASTALVLKGGGVGDSSWTDRARGQTLSRTGTAIVNSTSQPKFNSTSISFPGVAGNYLTTPSSSIYALGAGLSGSASTNFTLECWVYPTTQNLTAPCLISNYSGTFVANSWGLFYSHSTGGGASTFSFWASNFSTSAPMLQTPASFPLNAWYHIVLVRRGQMYLLYVNGKLIRAAVTAVALSTNAAQPLYIGAAGVGAATSFKGFVDDLRLTRASRVENSLTQTTDWLTNSTDDPYFASVVADFKMNSTSVSGATVTDSIGVTATLQGSSVISTADKKFGDASLYVPYSASGQVGLRTVSTITLGANDFTIECFVKPIAIEGSTYAQTMFDSRNSSTDISGIAVAFNQTGTNLLLTVNNVTTNYPCTIPLNSWSHIAVVKTASGNASLGPYYSLYINGVLAIRVVAAVTHAARQFVIGGSSVAAAQSPLYRPLQGYVDNFRITVGAQTSRYPKVAVPTSTIVDMAI